MGTSRAYRQAADLAAYWRDHPRTTDYTDEQLSAPAAQRRVRRFGMRVAGDRTWLGGVLAQARGVDPERRLACAALAIADRHCLATPRCSGCPMLDWECQHAATLNLRKLRKIPSPQVYALVREGVGVGDAAIMLRTTRAAVIEWCTRSPAPPEIERVAAMRIEDLEVIAMAREDGQEVTLWDDGDRSAAALAWRVTGDQAAS